MEKKYLSVKYFFVAAVSAVLAGMLLYGCAWRYVYRVPNKQDEILYCKSSDGWDLVLYRYKPEVINHDHYPVILCHGLGDNNHVWDLHEKASFASFLRDKGYDVWAVSFRGAGKSTKPGVGGLSKVLEVKFPTDEHYTLDPTKLDWNIEDHIEKDMPAFVSYIREKTGKKKLNCIGHSLGSMIICGYIQKFGNEDINSVVCLGLPIVFDKPLNVILSEVEKNKDLVRLGGLFNVRIGAQIGAPIAGEIQTPKDILTYNKENILSDVIKNYYSNNIEDLAPGVMNQYLEIIKTGDHISADGSYNYSKNMNKIKVPILFLGGKLDNIAPPSSVLYAYENVGSNDKAIKIMGKQDFCNVDYGHLDLVVGKHAPKEVYPLILNWMNAYSVTGKTEKLE